MALIPHQGFDVLIADLNIGEPADGFTVVSAMRRAQPDTVTMILTGYPAFQAALRVIHEQVDDFLTKPPNRNSLSSHCGTILPDAKNMPRFLLRGWRRSSPRTGNKFPVVVRGSRKNPEVKANPLTDDERVVDHLPEVLDELVRESSSPLPIDAQARASASRHGYTRRNLLPDLA